MASRKSKSQKNRNRPSPRPIPNASPERVRAATRPSPVKELVGLKPQPASNERVEDIAVFTNVGREQLSDALKLECAAVMEALESTYAGNFALANERLQNIARSSPYADWRLFVRGLCGFYQKDFETAKQNWQRLDASRRPARIAATLISAELNEPLAGIAAPPKRLVEAARMLLHRSSAIAAAKQIMSVKRRDPEVRFSPSQVAMLTNFRDDFRRVDAEFVAKFSQACVYLASVHSSPDVFLLLKNSVPGPPHDPHWNLQEFLFTKLFEDVVEVREEAAESYIEKDLPGMTQFSKEQKDALASCILLELANEILSSAAPSETPFYFFADPPEYKAIEKLLGAAIKRYPTNREAHKLLFDILERQIGSERTLTKAQIEAAEKRLIKAKEAYVSAFPGEVDTSLELVDHYFSNDELDKANALVKQLSSQRLDAPLAKALPWKLQLLGAMYKSRKKADLNSAREALAVAESQWPTWLARTWLPFLKAALELRVGNQELFESLDKQARQDARTSQLACDFMTFAAIQQMNVPAAVIKPYRETITKHLASVEQTPLADLISIGAFFWDLSRTGLEHKAFRLQASKIGKEINSRLKKGEAVPHSAEFIDASCFCANRGYWQTNFDVRQPPWAAELSKSQPKVAAAFIGWVNKSSYSAVTLRKHRPLVDALQEAAKTEKDPFYRYRFEQVSLAARESIAESERGRSSPDTARGFMDIGGFGDDDYDEDLIDENCQCADCRAERARRDARAERSMPKGKGPQTQPQSQIDFVFDYREDEEDEEDYEVDDDFEDNASIFDFDSPPGPELQALLLKIADKVGPNRLDQFGEALGVAVGKAEYENNPSIMMGHVVKVFNQFGLSTEDAVEFLRVMARQIEEKNGGLFGPNDASSAQPQRPPMTAEERKAADKKRRRELEKKKRR